MAACYSHQGKKKKKDSRDVEGFVGITVTMWKKEHPQVGEGGTIRETNPPPQKKKLRSSNSKERALDTKGIVRENMDTDDIVETQSDA